MKYGLIGKKLGHSFSKEIHNYLGNTEYELKELSEKDFHIFMKKRNFLGINVTIPYKQDVIKYLDWIDDDAKEIGAVNTVVNKNGKLYGYNTDAYGLKSLIVNNKFQIKDKNIYILGTGGTSKTAYVVCKNLDAKKIIKVSRQPQDEEISYDDFYKNADEKIIINTTPVGMFPNNESPIDLKRAQNVQGVIDVVYNPLKTKLCSQTQELNIKNVNGLFMLVAQAVYASSKFIGTNTWDKKIKKMVRHFYKEKENIVLIGMPSSGKTTIGKKIANLTGRKFYDADAFLEKKLKKKISTIFKEEGEEKFREYETEVIKELSSLNGVVIATGGGVILNKNNISLLKQNGRVYYLNKKLEYLFPTDNRPTASSVEAIKKLYIERKDLYLDYADVIVNANKKASKVASWIAENYLD